VRPRSIFVLGLVRSLTARLFPAAHGVLYIKYASILIQAITVELDEDFAYALYDFSQFDGAAWQEQPEEYVDRRMPRIKALAD
jgi:hypothetical protein